MVPICSVPISRCLTANIHGCRILRVCMRVPHEIETLDFYFWAHNLVMTQGNKGVREREERESRLRNDSNRDFSKPNESCVDQLRVLGLRETFQMTGA